MQSEGGVGMDSEGTNEEKEGKGLGTRDGQRGKGEERRGAILKGEGTSARGTSRK